MDTNKLIDELTNDLQPVKRLPSPLTRSLTWASMALLFVAIMIYPLGGIRFNLNEALTLTSYLFENTLAFFAGLLASIAVFKLSIPDTQIHRSTILMITLSSLTWLGISLYNLAQASPESLTQAWYMHQGAVNHCLTDLLLMTFIPLGCLIYMIRKAAPIHFALAGFSSLLAISAFASIAMRILCASDDTAHLFFWHYAPILAIAGAGIFIGRFCFRW